MSMSSGSGVRRMVVNHPSHPSEGMSPLTKIGDSDSALRRGEAMMVMVMVEMVMVMVMCGGWWMVDGTGIRSCTTRSSTTITIFKTASPNSTVAIIIIIFIIFRIFIHHHYI